MTNNSNKDYFKALFSVFALLLALLHVAGAQAPAQDGIRNQAFATFIHEDREIRQGSNVVVTIIRGVCDLSIVPSGSILEPAHRVAAAAGRTVTLPYLLTNTGNLTSDYSLDTILMPESTQAPADVRVVWDQNDNGIVDPGEPGVTQLTGIPPGQQVPLLLVVTLQEGISEGEIFVDLQGACAGEPTNTDAGNIAHIILAAPQGGFSQPIKTSEPAQDEPLYGGAELRYAIEFTNNDLPLRDVVVTDTLVEGLNDPISFTRGLIADPATGLSATATASYEGRTLRWAFAEIPAGMTVRLAVTTSVSADAPLENPIENRACVREGVTGTEVCTNVVRHMLAASELVLEKTAEPASVTLGDEVRYSLSVRNPSEWVPVRDVELRDMLPVGLAYVEGSANITTFSGSQEAFPPTINGTVLFWQLPDLEPNQRFEVTFSATVEETALAFTEVTNVAEVVSRDAGGSVIVNDEDSAQTEIFTICALDVTPNGTVDSPAHSVTVLPDETIYLPYLLTNTGNVVNSYGLEGELAPESSAIPEVVEVIWDQNADGVADPGEPVVTEVSDLPVGASVSLLVRVVRGADPEQGGEAFVNLLAWCAGNPNIADTDNVSYMVFLQGGVSGLIKGSEFAPGEVLQPGASIRYFVQFSTNQLPLYDVVITDPLDDNLDDPTSFTNGLITDPDTGLSVNVTARYENRTLRWHFAEIPAGMTVRLEFEAEVSMMNMTQAVGVISNIAYMMHGSILVPTPTNEVDHSLQPLTVLLQKTADKQSVEIGEEITYSLVVRNPSAELTLDTLVLTDILPEAVAYLPGSSILILPDGRTQASEPTVDANILHWQLPALEPSVRVEVRFRVRIKANALNLAELVNEAFVEALDDEGSILARADASVPTAVNLGIFAARSILMGHVFVDENENGVFDRGTDTPLEGVRLYLSSGVSVVSDALGRYTVIDLDPGVLALRLDMTTVPARHLRRTITEDKEGLWRLRLHPGVITRQDVIFAPAGTSMAMQQSLNVSRGPVSVTKSATTVEGGLEVRLLVSSTEALPDLTLVEPLPHQVSLSAVSINGTPVNPPQSEDGALTLELGNVSQDYSVEVLYFLLTDEEPQRFMAAPDISWRLR